MPQKKHPTMMREYRAVVLTDTNYGNERDLAEMETRGIDGYVALGQAGKKPTKSGDPKTAPAT